MDTSEGRPGAAARPGYGDSRLGEQPPERRRDQFPGEGESAAADQRDRGQRQDGDRQSEERQRDDPNARGTASVIDGSAVKGLGDELAIVESSWLLTWKVESAIDSPALPGRACVAAPGWSTR